jgi:hypothetical protein
VRTTVREGLFSQAARVIPDTNATFSYVLPVQRTFGDESVTKSAMRIFSEDLPQKATKVTNLWINFAAKVTKFATKSTNLATKSGHKTGIVRIDIILFMYVYYCIVQKILIFLLMRHGYSWINSYLLFKTYYL